MITSASVLRYVDFSARQIAEAIQHVRPCFLPPPSGQKNGRATIRERKQPARLVSTLENHFQ
jgi:hypothetical protein